MNTKALYWIALGAFALALNSQYQNGGLPLARRVADQATAIYCQVAERAEQTLVMARLMTTQPDTEVSTDEFVVRQQAEIDRVMALHQAELNRAMAMRQAELGRAMALRQADLDRIQQQVEPRQTEKGEDQSHGIVDRLVQKDHQNRGDERQSTKEVEEKGFHASSRSGSGYRMQDA